MRGIWRGLAIDVYWAIYVNWFLYVNWLLQIYWLLYYGWDLRHSWILTSWVLLLLITSLSSLILNLNFQLTNFLSQPLYFPLTTLILNIFRYLNNPLRPRHIFRHLNPNFHRFLNNNFLNNLIGYFISQCINLIIFIF